MTQTGDCDTGTVNYETDIAVALYATCKDGNQHDEGRNKADERSHRSSNSTLPIDRGWAWVVLAASFFELAIVVGYFKCFGIFFVQLQQRFKSTSAATSVIFSLQNVFYSLSALLVMNLGQSVSARFFVVLGAVVVAATFFITGFMESLPLVYFFGGVLSGMSNGCIQPNVVAMINTYFKKYRGLASNIAGSGVSIGALALAPVYTTMFEHYGFTSTYITQAAIVLQVVVVGMLLRPMEYYKRRIRRSTSLTAMYKDEAEILIPTDEALQPVSDDMPNNSNIDTNSLGGLADEICDLSSLPGDCNTIQECKTYTLESIRHDRRGAFMSRIMGVLVQIRQQLLNNRLLKDRVFLYYLVCNVFLCAGCVIVEGYVAPHAVDVGIDSDRVALVIVFVAIADICFKGPFAYLSDRKWIARSTIMAIAAIVLGICSFFMFFLNTFTTVVVYAVVAGSLQPVYFTLYPVVAIDILSLEELKSALGFIAVTQGVTVSVCFPLAGLLRDTTGRYYFSFCFAGALLLIGGVLCYFLPTVKRLCDRRSTEKKASSEDRKG